MPMDSDRIRQAVEGRLVGVLPAASKVLVEPSPAESLCVRFHLHSAEHRVWLHRTNGNWQLDEHRVNGSPQPKLYNGALPRFEDLILAVVESGTKRPRISVVEMRCPDDPRRMFGKLVVQRTPSEGLTNLLEFLCPQCKRTTGFITMHYFSSSDGSLVKSQANEPWIKTEPTPWFSQTRPEDEDDEDAEGSFLPEAASV